MSSLRRDLVERKLWMLVALLVVGVAAVPVLLLKHASASGAALPPAPPAASTVSQTTTGAQPPADEPVKVVLARIARDPFASGVPKLTSKPAPSSSGSSTSTTSTTSSSTSTAASSSPSTTVSMVSPSPDTSSPASSASSSTSTTPTTSTPPSTTSTPTSTIASTSPNTQAAKPTKVQSWTTYSVTVRFGKDAKVPAKSNIARLTPMPSARQPEVMFMGVLSTGRSAVFALRQGVGHTGPGLCRPNHALCSAIVLREGQSEHITIPPATSTAKPQTMILRVVKITSSITHSQQAALDAFERVSHAGVCDLLLADPMLYNLGTGTLSTMPKSTCEKYPNAVPFSYFRTAP